MQRRDGPRRDKPKTLFIANAHRAASLAWPRQRTSAESSAAAALAFDHLVALLQQPLALAIFAFLLFLDVGAFLAGHEILHMMRCGDSRKTGCDPYVIALTRDVIPVYKPRLDFQSGPMA
jgi:hypothetical protein